MNTRIAPPTPAAVPLAPAWAAGGRRRRSAVWILLSPVLVLLLVFFVGPLAMLFVFSFYKAQPGNAMIPSFTLENYGRFFTEPLNLRVLWHTLALGFNVTIGCVALGFPLAYNLARTRDRRLRAILIALLLVPMTTSTIVRSYGWMILLGNNGLVDVLLRSLGLARQPVQLMYTNEGTTIALIEVLLPFMVLTLMPVLQNIDRSLEQAAQSLGAGVWRTFLDIVLPLSMPGIAAGSLFVFALAIASYATPALIGGAKLLVMSLFIYQQALALFNWPFGAAISFVLLFVVLLLVLIQTRLLERERRWDYSQ